MYLYFDNTIDSQIYLSYYLNNQWIQKIFNSNHEGDLLLAIAQLLDEIGKKLTDINGIAARVGQGRFTATRIAVTTANTLAFSLKIPVISVPEFDGDHIIFVLKDQLIGQYALPQYSATASVKISKPQTYAV